MKKSMIIYCVMLVLGVSGVASALPYTFDMGSGSTVDTSGTNSVLVMYANVNPNLDNIIFNLNSGESYTFKFATIGTNESTINNDDLNPGTLMAYIDFDNPDLMENMSGTSIGFSAFWNFYQGWNLTWGAPKTVLFGNGGQFTLSLSDVDYDSCLWQGPDGSADVYATVKLDSAPAPVPEPATLLLLGSGLLGLAGFRRKNK